METLTAILKPVEHGWAVALSDGRELARFTGLAARRRALCYLSTHDIAREASKAA